MSESPLYLKIIKKLEKGTKEEPSIEQDLLIRICANQGEIYARRKEKAEREKTIKEIDNTLDMLKHGSICIHPNESHQYCKKFNECTGCVLTDLKNKLKQKEAKKE